MPLFSFTKTPLNKINLLYYQHFKKINENKFVSYIYIILYLLHQIKTINIMDFEIIRNLALIASYKLSLEPYVFWGNKCKCLSVYLYINNCDTIRISDHISSSNEVFTYSYIIDNGKIYYPDNNGIYKEISRTEFLKNIYKIKNN